MKKAIFVLAAVAATTFFSSVNAAPAATAVMVNKTIVQAAPPQAVLNAFATLFGNAPVRQWKLRSNGNWRAHFTLNGVAWEATFTPAGVLVKSERD
jgi:hypothetical protein